MIFNPDSGEEGGNSGGWTESGGLKDEEELEVKLEKETDGEEEKEKDGESGTESKGELSREMEEEKCSNGEEKKGNDGSLADDEDEDEDDEPMNEVKGSHGFTPLVTVVCPTSKVQDLNETSLCEPQENRLEPLKLQTLVYQHPQHPPEWTGTQENKPCHCECRGERVKLIAGLSTAAVLFPLLVWGGFEFLPFDTPHLSSSPFRVVYTLRCAFFATFPIIFGLLVEGVSRFKFGELKPLFEGNHGMREVVVHGNYVRDSMHLYLLYFLQLAVTATYIPQDMLKLVPLLTIVFVFGRLIYWVCVVFGSSFRSLGFGLSFLPVLVLLGSNLYFVCSSVGPDVLFDVAPPPTTAPPPKKRWWG
ncbi:transmembrane protein 79 isoform X2 [Hoplias malabaricus]|uniref:transmembrane protein 79 isoform X2 n=1 Tax=Hoplias malabaricus TaxID=27720 RepID=UPI003461EC69